jgi:hypothetical protein
MDDDQRHRQAFLKGYLASLERLKGSGLITAYGFGPGVDDGWIEFAAEITTLLRAGRSPMSDPQLHGLIARGASPTEVRAWLEAAVAALETDGR